MVEKAPLVQKRRALLGSISIALEGVFFPRRGFPQVCVSAFEGQASQKFKAK